MKKAAKIAAVIVAVSGPLQRVQTVTETLVNLNFKVPADLRDKRLAFEARLKSVQLLVRSVEALEREGKEVNHRNGRVG
jgi:hypothetical protein